MFDHRQVIDDGPVYPTQPDIVLLKMSKLGSNWIWLQVWVQI